MLKVREDVSKDLENQSSQLADCVKRVFIHNISLIKNLEYDVNNIAKEFEEMDVLASKPTPFLEHIMVPEIRFVLPEPEPTEINGPHS